MSKQRCIGALIPDSEKWQQFMQRFTLDTISGMNPDNYLKEALKYGSKEQYDLWLDKYRRNDGTFLNTLCWGHDRDLGNGQLLYGAMDDRHLSNLQRIVSGGKFDPEKHIRNKRCNIIGCWSGDENLLLFGLGASQVDGIEEVPVYAQLANMQLRAWAVPGYVQACSLYSIPAAYLRASYDLVYMPGVLYHLTDPICAIAICWALLKTGGMLAFETEMSTSDAGQSMRLRGASVPGWNWWLPAHACIKQIMLDCGFTDVIHAEATGARSWWIGTKSNNVPLLKSGAAGFSRPDILEIMKSQIT